MPELWLATAYNQSTMTSPTLLLGTSTTTLAKVEAEVRGTQRQVASGRETTCLVLDAGSAMAGVTVLHRRRGDSSAGSLVKEIKNKK